MSNLYKKYAKADIKNKAGGYKPHLYFAPLDTFLVCALPDPGVTPALGDTVKILEDHTFNPPDGWIDLQGVINSATSKYTTVGDAGSAVREHSVIINIEGNSPELYEQLGDLLDDECVFLLKDGNCIDADAYDQWGDDCLTPTVKVDFDAKTTADGTKIHVVTLTIREHKYWYYGTLTEKTYEAALVCPVITVPVTSTTATPTAASALTAHHFIFEIYTAASGGSPTMTFTGGAGVLSHSFTGLTTATTYYAHLVPVSALGIQLQSCARVGFTTA